MRHFTVTTALLTLTAEKNTYHQVFFNCKILRGKSPKNLMLTHLVYKSGESQFKSLSPKSFHSNPTRSLSRSYRCLHLETGPKFKPFLKVDGLEIINEYSLRKRYTKLSWLEAKQNEPSLRYPWMAEKSCVLHYRGLIVIFWHRSVRLL